MSTAEINRCNKFHNLRRRLHIIREEVLSLGYDARSAGRPGEQSYLNAVADKLADCNDSLSQVQSDPMTNRPKP